AAYGLLTCPPCLSVWSFQQRQGYGFAHVLTRSVLAFGCAPRAASVRALDTASTQMEPNGKGVKGTVEYRSPNGARICRESPLMPLE
ncbi:hypothetical protein DE74_11975, partial [Salmonella enterica subsp. enterica serovar Schwarzengrund]